MRALEVARASRALGFPPAVIRSMTYRDLGALLEVLREEDLERKRRQAKDRARRR